MSPSTPTALVRSLVGAEVDLEVIATDPWTARMLLAPGYGRDGVFLVGDAAHLNPPWGGHGFNTCIGDAANLAWKIAAALEGWGGPALLGSYELERRPVAERTIRDAAANGQALAYHFADPALGSGGAAGEAARLQAKEALAVKQSEFDSLGLVLGYDVLLLTPGCPGRLARPGRGPHPVRSLGQPRRAAAARLAGPLDVALRHAGPRLHAAGGRREPCRRARTGGL